MVRVSVVIPLYNKEGFIGRTIRSILNQTIQDFEIIVIDDGSVDGSSGVVKSFQDIRIRLFRQKNQGVSNARNNGIKYACSDFIAFLDADDEWLPNHLQTLLRLRIKYPYAGAFTTAYKILETDGKIRLARYRAIPTSPVDVLIPNYFKSAALGDSPMNSSSIGIPKIIFNEVGGFLEGVWWGEDIDLFGKIAFKYPIAFSWDTGVIYHWDVSNRACKRPSVNIEPFVTTARDVIKKSKIPRERQVYIEEYIARKEIYRAACNLFSDNRYIARNILSNTKTRLFLTHKIGLYLLTFLPRSFVKKILNELLFK